MDLPQQLNMAAQQRGGFFKILLPYGYRKYVVKVAQGWGGKRKDAQLSKLNVELICIPNSVTGFPHTTGRVTYADL